MDLLVHDSCRICGLLDRNPLIGNKMIRRWFHREEVKKEGWSLDDELMKFTCLDGKAVHEIPWNIRHACEGLQIFGGTGSGKSSGTGRAVALAMLRAGFGGLVLCAKPDEAEVWRQLANEAGREGDLLLFSPESGYSFNFLDYEMTRPGRGGGITENVVSVLMQCAEVASGIRNAEDDIWEKAMRQLLRNAIDLCRLAGEPVRMATIHQIALGGGMLDELLGAVDSRELSDGDRKDYFSVRRYFHDEWAMMADRTKSGIIMNLTAVCDPFLRGALRDLFCEGTTVTPEAAQEGKILVVDLPVKTFNEMGTFAAVIWKFLFQRAAERRMANDLARPLFIFADESQYFVTSSDAVFQTTARSSRTATVYLTQNLPNYLAELGGSNGKARIDSLLGNLQTKIFHQNGDSETNRWASELLTRSLQMRSSISGSVAFRGGAQAGTSEQESWEFEVPPGVFLRLAKGGPDYRHVVTAVLFQSGRQFPNGRHWAQIVFQQK